MKWAILAASLAGAGWAGWAAVPKAPATVTFFLSTDCPVAMQYTGRINRMVGDFSRQGVKFQARFPNDLESRDTIARYMSEREYAFPFQLDLGAVEAKKQGVTHVPYVIVQDASGKVVYRGAIDDHKDPNLARKSYLSEALAAVTAGRSPTVKEAKPFGCVLMPGAVPPSKTKVNYAQHIAPILNKNCVQCHRPGEVAPFSLTTYAEARKWAPMVALTTESRRMPPWMAVAGYSDLKHENRLTETEIATLKTWADAGAPAGDLKKAPPTPKFSSGWANGEPDLVLGPSRPFKLAGEGKDEYRNFVVDPGNKETLWVRGMDVKPGNRQVVHHVIAFIDTSGRADRRAAATKDGQEGYATFGGPGFNPYGSLGGWAPGTQPFLTPEGTAFEVPPGAKIVIQVHYHRTGKAETDLTKIGLYVAKEKPRQPMYLAWLANPIFRIPPGAKDHKVQLNAPVPADVTVYGSMPHMHLLGKSMRSEFRLPDGQVKPLIWVNNWDFNWQMQYTLREPLRIPKGARVYVEGFYDNSSDNRNNPNDPPQPVTWGEETTDEMFLLIVPYTIDGETLEKRARTRMMGFGDF